MILPRLLGLLLLALLGLPRAAADDKAPSPAGAGRDLVLEATLTSAKTIEPGQPVHVAARITNRSKTTSYPVPLPGRRPGPQGAQADVSYTASIVRHRARREAVPRIMSFAEHRGPGRPAETVTLGPRKTLDLELGFPAANQMLALQKPGRVEMRVRYGCHGAKGETSREGVAVPAHDRKSAPAFELTSEPVEFTVVRHVELRMAVTGSLEVGMPSRLSNVLQLHVENTSSGPRLVSGAEFHFELTRHSLPPRLFASLKDIPPTVERKSPPLEPGGTRTWAGSEAWKELRDRQLSCVQSGWFEVVAIWTPTGSTARYVSEPARVLIK